MAVEEWLCPVPLEIPECVEPVQMVQIANFLQLRQAMTMWCWAAVALSINKFYIPMSGWSQCLIANQAFNMNTCCANPTPNACNQTYHLHNAMTIVAVLAGAVAAPAAYAGVTAAVNGNHPIGITIDWYAGGAHSLSIYGYLNGPPQTILVGDPWFGASWVDFNNFPHNYLGGATWASTCWSG